MPRPDRVRLVVLFGGQSAEHEVSCVSAFHVLRAVDQERYDLEAVGITRDGDWVRADDAIAALHRGAAELPGRGTDRLEATGTAIEPLPAVTPAIGDDVPVVVLPLLHGPHGEDGTVQGMLELAGVPFVGAGVLGSALCMDKLKAKDVLAAHGLPQVPWIGLRDTELDDLVARVADAGLRYPLFVKPANLGSSVGREPRRRRSRRWWRRPRWRRPTTSGSPSRRAPTGARSRSRCSATPTPRASVPGEVVPGHDFYDYEDKYVEDGAELRIPADLPDGVAEEIRRLALEAFTTLRCDGMARVDFFYEEDDRGVLINEVNTIPGFTPISQYPKLWEASGLPYDRAHRRARPPRPRAPRAPQPLLHEAS